MSKEEHVRACCKAAQIIADARRQILRSPFERLIVAIHHDAVTRCQDLDLPINMMEIDPLAAQLYNEEINKYIAAREKVTGDFAFCDTN